MKLLFSEGPPNYQHYIFPYVIWAFAEPGEDISRIFDAGFLPSSRLLNRFYMARQVRIALKWFVPSSENRRVLRKGEIFKAALLTRSEFDYSARRREAFKAYAEVKFGPDVMTFERLDELFNSPLASHILHFTTSTGEDAGSVVLFLHRKLAFYYYAFYDLRHFRNSLGLYMMTYACAFFAEQGYEFLYLGTCYSEKALYKTQFTGAEFFNGFSWSQKLQELKFIVRRNDPTKHLLEDPQFLDKFYPLSAKALAEQFGLRR